MYLYAAYGSNLNKSQMLKRCPNSKPFNSIILPNYRLVFKGVADIEKYKNHKIFLGIYKITEKCELALDGYEDFPSIYQKSFFNYMLDGKKEKIMFYAMNKKFSYAIPGKKYFNVIRKGYNDWKFNINNLKKAGCHSIEFNTDNGFKSKNWKDSNMISKQFIKSVK